MIATSDPPKLSPCVDWQTYQAICTLEHDYARSIDDDQLERWPHFFVEDCFYQIIPRENIEQGLPLGLLSCDSKGMLLDRLKSLRDANIYNIHYPRHFISNIEVIDQQGSLYQVHANYMVIQSDQEGFSKIFSVGHYRDKVVWSEDGWRFQEKVVVVDTFNIQNLLALPL